jgi:hypothetical protein
MLIGAFEDHHANLHKVYLLFAILSSVARFQCLQMRRAG